MASPACYTGAMAIAFAPPPGAAAPTWPQPSPRTLTPEMIETAKELARDAWEYQSMRHLRSGVVWFDTDHRLVTPGERYIKEPDPSPKRGPFVTIARTGDPGTARVTVAMSYGYIMNPPTLEILADPSQRYWADAIAERNTSNVQ